MVLVILFIACLSSWKTKILRLQISAYKITRKVATKTRKTLRQDESPVVFTESLQWKVRCWIFFLLHHWCCLAAWLILVTLMFCWCFTAILNYTSYILYCHVHLYYSPPLPMLISLANRWLDECVQELRQYPTLRVEVGNAAFESLERMRDESKKATLKLVDMESSYLTVDFFRKLPQEIEKGGNPTHSIFDRYNDSYLRRIGKWYSKWKVFMLKLLSCGHITLA